MTRALALTLLLALTAAAAPIPEEERQRLDVRRVFGTLVNPDPACDCRMIDGVFRVKLPGGLRFYRIDWLVTKTPPRTWKEVEGDFEAVVRVGGPRPRSEPFAGTGGASVYGSLTADDGPEFVILRRGIGPTENADEHFSLTHGNGPDRSETDFAGPPPQDAVYFRLRREGKTVRSSCGRDGRTWSGDVSITVRWGAKVKVGVVAESNTAGPVEVAFDHFTLTQPKK